MSTLAAIKARIGTLTSSEMRELSEWLEDNYSMLNAAELLGQSYDDEEKRSFTSGAQQGAGFMSLAGAKSGPPDLSQRKGHFEKA
jgi:hypothetical protein